MQAQSLPILVQKQDDMLKLKDSPLHAEETVTDVIVRPMEALSEDDNEHDDHEMEEEDNEGSVCHTSGYVTSAVLYINMCTAIFY